jgi:pyruvate formate lyase activating enzyme
LQDSVIMQDKKRKVPVSCFPDNKMESRKDGRVPEKKGLVFDIQRSSTVDGPGIRTVVFLKGCPLKCVWCQNPESQKSYAEIRWHSERCIGCRKCIKACPKSAISLVGDCLITDRNLCINCGTCAKVCFAQARELCGRYMTAGEVFNIVKRDIIFYNNTGGGITVSGGEPTSQPAFLVELLKKCKDAGIHTAVDTCGYFKWGVFEDILRYTDLVLFDLKHMDSKKHYEYMGVYLEPILENLRKIDKSGKDIWIRTPLVPGYNDSIENLEKQADLMAGLKNLKRFDLLPYHSYGRQKYPMLDLVYGLEKVKSPSVKRMQTLKKIFEKKGIKEVHAG